MSDDGRPPPGALWYVAGFLVGFVVGFFSAVAAHQRMLW